MTLFSGKTALNFNTEDVKGSFIDINGEKYYKIENYDKMLPFFISLSSNCDIWTYLSSSGGITAGRQNPNKALFPYYTDDKITEAYETTGSKTIVRVRKDGDVYLWEPFSDRQCGAYDVKRSIAKSTVGNKIIFTEENRSLGLSFSYCYCNAARSGFIKRSTLQNISSAQAEVEILDGLQNLLPDGVEQITQARLSCLVDAYKKTEMVAGLPLALFRMESILADVAEPSESLRCNVVWCAGMPAADYLLSSTQIDKFRKGGDVVPETESKGVRGAMFVHKSFSLGAGGSKTWYFVADVAFDAVKLCKLKDYIMSGKDIAADLESEIAAGTKEIVEIVGEVDGLQQTGDEADMARHFANCMFNTMRGGFYCDNYNISTDKFKKHISVFNKKLAERQAAFLDALPADIDYGDLGEKVRGTGDKQLLRLYYEYLPLTFSRRHGDPSRPWNLFDIKVNDENGKRIISYQGNWRDIFQNWEALSLSYPQYLCGIIAKFLNATTVDGYNPYKVTSEGIDWEVIEPENPWSNIGYWGDHQIIYLLKLMELAQKYYPGSLKQYFNEAVFAYANVPYKFKKYSEIVADPKNSVYFDDNLHKRIFEMLPSYGQDARLVLDKDGEVLLATFTEKILASYLAKLTDFIPEAGIWMNTLRPEWNDANNALVGYGASMVTLYYMRRYAAFMKSIFETADDNEFELSGEMAAYFAKVSATLRNFMPFAKMEFDDASRRSFADAMGKAAEEYRNEVYAGFTGAKQGISKSSLVEFFSAVLVYLDESIAKNKREDGMYHAYNLIEYYDGGIRITRLYEMLEGQVAVLSALQLTPAEVLDLLKSLRASSLYRADQNSYILYPNKKLPLFSEKNNISSADKDLPVVRKFSAVKGIIMTDEKGGMHFNADFRNARLLSEALDRLPVVPSAEERRQLLDLYEKVFNHRAFTGRSGTFYKYEGLGCIYWHMVSKLLLAVGENVQKAVEDGADAETVEALKSAYYDIRDGIGAHKTPDVYGAFPFDAYSHTPSMAGVQQPGMTGQVKEDIINRFFELGVKVEDGKISFNSLMLKDKDFNPETKELRFTLCHCPVVYKHDGQGVVSLDFADGSSRDIQGLQLDAETSAHIFARDGFVNRITVSL